MQSDRIPKLIMGYKLLISIQEMKESAITRIGPATYVIDKQALPLAWSQCIVIILTNVIFIFTYSYLI